MWKEAKSNQKNKAKPGPQVDGTCARLVPLDLRLVHLGVAMVTRGELFAEEEATNQKKENVAQRICCECRIVTWC